MKTISSLIDKLHVTDIQKPEFQDVALEIKESLANLVSQESGSVVHADVAAAYSSWESAVEQGTLGGYNRAVKEVLDLLLALAMRKNFRS